MTKALISVIIPTRDRETYLRNLLNDLQHQDLPPIEVIVVDQSHSPYKELNCTHISDEGVGPCRAKNLGIKAAHGEILVFLDDDIRIGQDFIYHLCEPIIKKEYMAVAGAICDKEGNYPFQSAHFWRKKTSSWLVAITANPSFPGRSLTLSFPTGCSAIAKHVVEEIGQFDEFFDPDGAGEDREYAFRIFHSGYPILYNGEAKVNHLAAQSGGRRSVKRKGLSPLELNCVYIAAKYFHDDVFSEFCNQWLFSIINRYLSFNPKSWWRTYNYLQIGHRWIDKIRCVKIKNNWI